MRARYFSVSSPCQDVGLRGGGNELVGVHLGVDAQKIDPGIAPGILGVGGIVGNLAGRDQKGIPRPQLESVSVDFQNPFPGQDKMDQLVGTVDRAVVMPRRAGFVPRTVQRQIGNLFLLQSMAGFFVFNHKASIAQKVCFFHILLGYFHGGNLAAVV